MKNKPYNLRINVHTGFSLVEVMVGMVIALLGTIIIFQVFSVSEGIKRTTTSGGDATQNGAMALYVLEHTLKQAGYGFLPADNVNNVAADPLPNTKLVDITAGAANATDSIVVRYRPNWEFGKFQPAPGAFPAIAIPALTAETISVNNKGQLVSDVNGVIAEGIAMLKLEYGVDTDSDGTSDTWTQVAPVAPLNALDVWAVRIAVVARSAQPEKPNDTGVCDTTKAAPTWMDSAALPLDLSGKVGLDATDDWKCYRYKTFESTVALRN